MDRFVILSFRLTRSNVHESQVFEAVWDDLPDNVVPIRSLADSAYMGNDCLTVARRHGATPLHKIKKNSKNREEPETFYEKLVNFAHHWPNRFAALTAKRSHVETVFSMVDSLLGYRLRCRTRRGRRNEVRVKYCLFDMVQLAMTPEFWSAEFRNKAFSNLPIRESGPLNELSNPEDHEIRAEQPSRSGSSATPQDGMQD